MKQTQGGNYMERRNCANTGCRNFSGCPPPPPSFSSSSLHPSPNPLSAFNLKQLKLIIRSHKTQPYFSVEPPLRMFLASPLKRMVHVSCFAHFCFNFRRTISHFRFTSYVLKFTVLLIV